MSRPKTTREFQERLAAGEPFKEIEGRGHKLSLKKIDLNADIQVFQLLVNNVPQRNMLIFICNSYIHKAESTSIFNISPQCMVQDLFFVELEFLNP